MIGEWAWLHLHHRVASSIKDGTHSKMVMCFYEAFKVVERIGSVGYHLQLPAPARIHNVFHVALKKFEGSPPVDEVALPDFVHGRVVPSPSAVVHARLN